MDVETIELETLISLQESYIDNLIELGLVYEHSGRREKAFDIYKKGLEKINMAKDKLSYTMLGLME